MWRQDKAVPEVAFSWFDDDWSISWHVAKRRYWELKQHLKTGFRMRCSLIVGRYNVEIFLIMTADRSGLYPVLPKCEFEYKCPYLLFVPTCWASRITAVSTCAEILAIHGG